MIRRVLALGTAAALSVLVAPAHAQPAGQLVTLGGAYGQVTITYKHLRDIDLQVRNARDHDAALAALSLTDRIAILYNFLPGSRTSVTFGPCVGGDPDQCDHPANPAQPPETVVKQPAPTYACGHDYEGFEQKDLAQLTLYSFMVDIYRCIDGTNIQDIEASATYGDENYTWTCDYDPEAQLETARWPKYTFEPMAPAQAITVTSVGQCHSDVHFDVLGRRVDAQWQLKHPKIVVEMRGDGSAIVVKES